ncbi:hypothetical protein NDI37_08790 [Funiculus sociatus GB2-A5]|uniref:Uncharacterized protein n=1 Tax=Funiculus sociatus GB2-A5 TaxID=2933946 RepID=A0ABV0JMB7_9CYAN|nr:MULTISPECIES: hypothetical protein [unclassified Trichocoleus]MBD1904930.1 hypothetical protein [Trichocoleus sp. FACHB-832]MBD2064690.1 hypothetical protein [Trichocoleus sp. FACHB-6]
MSRSRDLPELPRTNNIQEAQDYRSKGIKSLKNLPYYLVFTSPEELHGDNHVTKDVEQAYFLERQTNV